jgi:hypothetical protein
MLKKEWIKIESRLMNINKSQTLRGCNIEKKENVEWIIVAAKANQVHLFAIHFTYFCPEKE